MVEIILWGLLVLGVAILGLGLLLWAVAYLGFTDDAPKVYERQIEHPRPAVLIPARFESNVIEGILTDLAKQSFALDLADVYVVVEDAEDPTIQICEKHGVSYLVRQKLSPRTARKGYALDEVVKAILAEHKHYDLYFVFDADNRIERKFIEKMLQAYQAGYQMATSYRNALNAEASAVATSAILTFSMLNTIENRHRMKRGWNIIFSGTGCFVDGQLVEKWHGWPFRSLTEDYEMSLYAILHNVKTVYFEEAEFFDEQPVTFAQSFYQRLRWLKGYFSVRKKYVPLLRNKKNHAHNLGSIKREMIGMWPFILIAFGAIFSVVMIIILGIVQIGWQKALTATVVMVAVVYLVMFLVTAKLLATEKYRLNFGQKLKAALFNPVYLVSYVPCAVVALFKRNVVWTRIKHGN